MLRNCHTDRTMARTGRPATRHVAAVERAVAVLDALAEDGSELGTNELARRTGLHPSTVSRLLSTLAEAGLVEHVEDTGRYRLGIRLLQLGNAVLAAPGPARGRAPRAACARRRDRRDGDAERTGRPRRRDRRLRPERLVGPERRARSGARASPTRRRRARSPSPSGRSSSRMGASPRSLPARPPTALPSRPRSRPSGSRAGPRRSASARRTSTRSPRPCTGAGESSRRSSASRARPPGSTTTPARRRVGPLLARAAAVSDALGWRPTHEEAE